MLVPLPDGRLVEHDSEEHMALSFDPSLEDPFSVCAPFLEKDPEWLIIGGLGDVDEVGPALKRWPHLRVIGIDPDPRARKWQIEHSWPAGHPLLNYALDLYDYHTAAIAMNTICCASLHPRIVSKAPLSEISTCTTITLDTLSLEYGPFTDSILWLDLEGWDEMALIGAHTILTCKLPLLVNIEIRYENEAEAGRLQQLLPAYGYERVLTWFRQWWGANQLYRRT